MYKNAEEQKQAMLEKRENKDMALEQAAKAKERDAQLKREIEMIKREEKLENVERIARAT